MSIQKMARGPMMLMDKVFNIPLFSAKQQQYVCTEVAETGNDSTAKKYAVFFKEIPSSYSVPEIIRMDITLNHTNNQIQVQLFEKQNSGNYMPLYHRSYDKVRISSVTNIQSMINDLISD